MGSRIGDEESVENRMDSTDKKPSRCAYSQHVPDRILETSGSAGNPSDGWTTAGSIRGGVLEIHPCTHILLCSQVFQSWLAVASSDHILLCLAQVTEKKKGIIATT